MTASLRTKSVRTMAEDFLFGYIADNVDERGEVSARACIAAAEEHGIPETAITKARFINRELIGSYKAGRRDGWIWYPLFRVYQDCTAEPESSVSDLEWREPTSTTGPRNDDGGAPKNAAFDRTAVVPQPHCGRTQVLIPNAADSTPATYTAEAPQP